MLLISFLTMSVRSSYGIDYKPYPASENDIAPPPLESNTTASTSGGVNTYGCKFASGTDGYGGETTTCLEPGAACSKIENGTKIYGVCNTNFNYDGMGNKFPYCTCVFPITSDEGCSIDPESLSCLAEFEDCVYNDNGVLKGGACKNFYPHPDDIPSCECVPTEAENTSGGTSGNPMPSDDSTLIDTSLNAIPMP